MSKILITGSTGYLCRFVINELLSSTLHEIIASYRNEKGDYSASNRLLFEKADLLTPKEFDDIFKKHNPDFLIHLAAMARVREGEEAPEDTFNANFTATVHLLELCNKYKVKSCLIASSNLAQGPVSTVGISKLLLEQYVLNCGERETRTILYRVPNILDSKGAVTHIFRRLIKNGKPITITHPDMSRSFIDGKNAAKETLYLLENGEDKGVYVSYKEPTRIIDLAKQMMKLQKKDLPIKIIGMKPGEKLTEHVFTELDIIKTDIPFLGKLRNYNFNHDLTVNSISKLNNKQEIANNNEIQQQLKNFF